MGLESPRINSSVSGTTVATAVTADDLEVDSGTLSVDATNNRVGINTESPGATLGIDGDLNFQPTATSTGHITATGNLRIRADSNLYIGDSTVDSIRLGRTNTTAAKIHVRSGTDSDLVVTNSKVGIGTDDPGTTLQLSSTTTALTLQNTTEENSDGGCESKILFEDHANVTLAQIQGSHDGASDDTKGDLIFSTHTGSALTEAMRIDSDGLVTISGNTDGGRTALVLTNQDDTADANGSVILRFDLEDTSGTAVDSGSIRVKKLNSFTNTASTQDSKMDFYVSEDGTLTRQGAFVGGSEFSFGNRNSTLNIDPSSGTNTAGKTLTIRGGAGTGSGAGGSIIFKTADGGGSGSSVNSHATALTLADDLSATFAGDVTVSGGDIAYGNGQDATLTVDAVSGTDTAGKDLTIKAGVGTGAGDPGDIHFQVAVPGGSGSSAQSTVPTMSMSPEGVSTFWGGTAALGNDTGVGDIVTFGTEDSSDTLAAGRLMYLHTDGKWKYCDADAVATGGTQLLGIALGTAVSDGLLIRGFFKLNSYVEGTWNEGLPCYVSEATGEIDFSAPSASGDFVRVVGDGTDTSGVIFFNPSATNIVIA